jgi:hypothetical protein
VADSKDELRVPSAMAAEELVEVMNDLAVRIPGI